MLGLLKLAMAMMNGLIYFEQSLLEIATDTGCHYISTMCRKGLAKKMVTKHGWNETYSVVTKPVPME